MTVEKNIAMKWQDKTNDDDDDTEEYEEDNSSECGNIPWCRNITVKLRKEK